jgi:hypothetical protein
MIILVMYNNIRVQKYTNSTQVISQRKKNKRQSQKKLSTLGARRRVERASKN